MADVFRVQIRVRPGEAPVSVREIRDALFPVFGALDLKVWRVIPDKVDPVKSDCDVCDALGLGEIERANAHPHRLLDVFGPEVEEWAGKVIDGST